MAAVVLFRRLDWVATDGRLSAASGGSERRERGGGERRRGFTGRIRQRGGGKDWSLFFYLFDLLLVSLLNLYSIFGLAFFAH